MKGSGKKLRFYWEEPVGKEGQPESAGTERTQEEMRIDIPGFRKGEIRASLSGNMITVSASRKSRQVQKVRGFYSQESFTNSFSKSMTLPGGISPKDFEVIVKDGAVLLKRKKKARSG